MDDVDDGCHWWFDSFFFRICCWCWLLNTLVILSYITGVYPLEKQRNVKQKTNIQTTSSSSIAHTFRILKMGWYNKKMMWNNQFFFLSSFGAIVFETHYKTWHYFVHDDDDDVLQIHFSVPWSSWCWKIQNETKRKATFLHTIISRINDIVGKLYSNFLSFFIVDDDDFFTLTFFCFVSDIWAP